MQNTTRRITTSLSCHLFSDDKIEGIFGKKTMKRPRCQQQGNTGTKKKKIQQNSRKQFNKQIQFWETISPFIFY
jgi:hypothetical protein